MRTDSRRWLKLIGLFFAVAVAAQAHPGHEGHELTWDFSTGLTHPFTGWDHILAMVAVGWWAAQLGGRARWLLPAAFVGLMSVGAALGSYGAAVPGLEQAIAASVLVLGLLVARAARLPVAIAIVVTGAFAVFHGLAHGAEGRIAGTGAGALLGFALATAALHGVGLALGRVATRSSATASTIAGSAIALCGAVMLVS